MVDSRRHDPNQNDLSFIKCPLCDKDMVAGLWHGCKSVLQSDEYVNKVKHMRLVWHPDFGWRCYGNFDGDYVGLFFSEVFNIVTDNKDWVSVGSWENPKLVKNIH